MQRDWAFEACCSRGWAAVVMMIALGLMGLGMLAAGWGLLHVERGVTPLVVLATVSGIVGIFVFAAAALIALADLIRPREPVVIVDALGIQDLRLAPVVIPWAAIRHASCGHGHLDLEVEAGYAPASPGWLNLGWRRSRGPVSISIRGLACAEEEMAAAIQRGRQTHGVVVA